MKLPIRVEVNGDWRELEVDTRTILAEMLREQLRLTGVHIGCATGNCGTCTVFLDGKTVKSCCILAADVDGQSVTTVESLADSPDNLHPIQQAFVDHQGLQCGFCTPGMIMSTMALLRSNEDPTDEEIRQAIAGNLCRCTGYEMIVESIRAAAQASSSSVGDA